MVSKAFSMSQGVLRAFQTVSRCFKGIPENSGDSKAIQCHSRRFWAHSKFQGVLGTFQGCFIGFRGFHGRSRKFQGCTRGLKRFQRHSSESQGAEEAFLGLIGT